MAQIMKVSEATDTTHETRTIGSKYVIAMGGRAPGTPPEDNVEIWMPIAMGMIIAELTPYPQATILKLRS